MSKIQEQSIQYAEFERQLFRVTADAGTTIDNLLDQHFWCHVASKLKPHDIVEVVPEDGAFYCELMVTNCAKLWAKMTILNHKDFAADVKKAAKQTEAIKNKYEAKWTGNTGKWKAVETATGDYICGDIFQTREEAEEFIEKFIKEVAAA